MDELEPFLKAIFADPADDLPRLVFADWLDEQDQPDWAWLIRAGCEFADDPERLAAPDFAERLARTPRAGLDRGFQPWGAIELPARAFHDAEAFRRLALNLHPHWYGARTLKVTGDRIADPAPLLTILTSPVTERVVELDLRGQVVDIPAELGGADAPGELAGLMLYDIERRPVIAGRMIEVLAGTREARRLKVLDLRDNDLDNDALMYLERSPYLHQLTRLDLLDGNRFKGRNWQRILTAYGEDVVQ